MKQTLLYFSFILFSLSSIAQKKNITLSDFNDWNTLKKFELTPDGKHLVYEVAPLIGNSFVVIQNMNSLETDTIHRASKFQLDSESQYVACYIQPLHDTLRAMKLREVKKKDLPKDSLGIWVFNDDSLQLIPDIKSFELSGEGSTWLAYSVEKYKEPKEETGKKKKKKKKKGTPESKKVKTPKEKQGAITLFEPIARTSKEYPYATQFAFAKEAKSFAVINYRNSNFDSAWIETIANTDTFNIQINANKVAKLTWDEQGTKLAYLASADTTKEVVNFDLQLLSNNNISTIADSNSAYKYAGFGPSDNGRMYFSQNGKQLYFGIAPLAIEEPEDTLLKDEKAYVDVWHYQDLRIQPEQLKQLKRDENRTFLTVFHVNENRLVQLADSTLENVYLNSKHNQLWAYAYNRKPYSIERTWEYPWKSDIYSINIQDGSSMKLLEKVGFSSGISTNGRFAYWYNSSDNNWYTLRVGTSDTVNITKSLTGNGVILYNEEGEVPAAPSAFGLEGWFDNDEYVLIKSKNELWIVDPTGQKEATDLLNGLGKAKNLDATTYSFEDDFFTFKTDSTIFIKARERATNKNYYFTWKNNELSELYQGDFNLRMPVKAKHTNQFVFRKESYTAYPNVWWLPAGFPTASSFAQTKQLTNANTQQNDFLWGTVEPYYWKEATGKDAKGLLYLPENFDSTKAYPMVVYFYEKNFETQHRHRTPRPSYSTISVPFYNSNGYIVFVPDIHYGTGHPAQDAYNAIVSGAESLAKESWVNGDKMGIQGQSWGGYQVAALVTKTNLFAAGMAGAPVSNMTSAYGGVRWGSGLSRMFQYEKTQSRIGGTLWDARDLYLENSPVFHIDKVTTPLLIMHADNDGAVPWYQGIEMYMSMRRLQKPAWMLVYNKEEHNLRKLPNRKDLSRRMFEFFNHYLKDEPMPVWMKEGVPAVNKKDNEGYGQ
jgi:dipeptidyl aminopeptidase/acylaminoacyl peptidase